MKRLRIRDGNYQTVDAMRGCKVEGGRVVRSWEMAESGGKEEECDLPLSAFPGYRFIGPLSDEDNTAVEMARQLVKKGVGLAARGQMRPGKDYGHGYKYEMPEGVFTVEVRYRLDEPGGEDQ